jgi:anti-anti-sigma factor
LFDRFQVVTEEYRGTVHLILAGEFDANACEQFREAALVLKKKPAVVDLRDISFMDSTAVRELLTLKGAIGADRLKIVRPRGYAVKIFEVTGLAEHLPLVDDPADAPWVGATSRDAAD